MNPILWISSNEQPLLRLDLEQRVANTAFELFQEAANKFMEDIDQVIEFDPGYQVQEGECFEIKDFPIDHALLSACKQPLSTERAGADTFHQLPVKAIVGYDIDGTNESLFFQNFDRRKLIVPGRRFAIWNMADSSTFRQLDRPVLLLDSAISALWHNGTLRFKSFHLAKQMFDLTEWFEEASDKQLVGFAKHKMLLCTDTNQFVSSNNYWTRKKIAMILRDGILDNVTPKDLKRVAKAVDYEIEMDGERMVIPEDTAGMRALLQFLDEDVYRGPFSGRRLIAGGKRVWR